MIRDLRVEPPEADATFDLCIIGGGPAGIALALETTERNPRMTVCLLESGGFEYDFDVQQLSLGESVGRPYFPLQATRLRQLGGTMGHWAGWCAPFNALDFEPRDWVEKSGWPLSRAELEPHYARATRFFELGKSDYEPASWTGALGKLPNFDAANVVARLWKFSAPPLRVGEHYRQALEARENLALYLHATVANIALDEAGSRVVGLDVSPPDLKRISRIRALDYALACGGFENARLLLSSDDVASTGVGNDRDVVGRFFHEHTLVETGTVRDAKMTRLQRLKRSLTAESIEVGLAFGASDELQRERRIGNCVQYFSAQSMAWGRTGWEEMLALRSSLSDGETATHLWRVLADFDTVAGVAALQMQGGSPTPIVKEDGTIELTSQAEQVPNRDSRVMLSPDKRDVLGMRRIVVDWRLADQDKRTVRESVLAVGAELTRLNLGRVQLHDWLRDESGDWPDYLRGGHHHMGTTRMGDDPESSVVDADARVHGIENLFVAGSSVFPTGGFANPTLTIVAMSYRLAGHLLERHHAS